MWKEIGDRERGILRPKSFTTRIKSNRIRTLQISNHKDIVSPHRASINSLQVPPPLLLQLCLLLLFFLSISAENFVFLGRYVVLFRGNWFHGFFRLIIYVIYVSLFEDEYRICSSGCDFNQTGSNSLCQLCMELEFYSRNQLNVDVIRIVLLGLSTRIKQEP